MRCHNCKDFDTRHVDFVELYCSFISGRRYIGPAFIYFEGPFCSWKGMLRIYKNRAQKVRRPEGSTSRNFSIVCHSLSLSDSFTEFGFCSPVFHAVCLTYYFHLLSASACSLLCDEAFNAGHSRLQQSLLARVQCR